MVLLVILIAKVPSLITLRSPQSEACLSPRMGSHCSQACKYSQSNSQQVPAALHAHYGSIRLQQAMWRKVG